MNRRNFLRAAIAGAAAVPFLTRPRRAEALSMAPLGVWSGSSAATHAGPIQRVFEIFLRGGISPFDTFLVEPGTASSCVSSATCNPTTDTRANFLASSTGVKWGTYNCGFTKMYTDELAARLGMPVTTAFSGGYHLGPSTWPLWPVADRMRVLTMRHSLGAHEPALALMQTGFTPGVPRSFSTAVAVNATYRDGNAPVVRIGGSDVRLPAAYAVTGHLGVGGYTSIFDSGQLGAQFRPLGISLRQCGATPNSEAFPARAPVSIEEQQLLGFYQNDFQSRLVRSIGGAVPSAVYLNYQAALADYLRADQVALALGRYDATRFPLPSLLLNSDECFQRYPAICTREQYEQRAEGDAKALHIGAFLLRECGARYVHALVGNLDTHEDHVRQSYSELSRLFQQIGALLSNGALPSDTLIVLTTEFGRTPAAQYPNGRNHFPECYSTVFLRPTSAAVRFPPRSVQGRVESDGSAVASTATSPAQLRAAMLVALGIDPFGPDGFNEGSVVGGAVSGTSHLEICRSLKSNVLGFVGA